MYNNSIAGVEVDLFGWEDDTVTWHWNSSRDVPEAESGHIQRYILVSLILCSL